MVDPNPRHPGRGLRIALAHDWLVGMRGGERVLEAIARTLAGEHEITAIYTMFDDGRELSPALDRIPRRVACLGRMPGATRLRRWLLPLYPAAVGSLSRRLARDHVRAPVDLVISTSSAAIKGLRAPEGVPHLCYCHTPARYLWSQADEYAGGLRGLGLAVFGGMLRRWDRRTAANVTLFLANSTHTAAEIKRCYGHASSVVFPPVRTGFFTPGESDGAVAGTLARDSVGAGARNGEGGVATQERGHARPPSSEGSAWLAVGALEAYKRFDLAIEAAARAGVELLIVGGGSDEPRLRAMAGSSARFLGRVDDPRLRELYRACRMLVFPQIEDFGIVAVEAQACGCPVLARRAGGALDTVADGRTGAYVEGASVESLLDGATRVPERSRATTAACRDNAERFGEERFAADLRRAVRDAVPGDRG